MEYLALKNQLLDTYSPENLNKITSAIIDFYKKKQQDNLKHICTLINDFYTFAESSDKKLFSKLIMLYHPDKILDYHKSITSCKNKESLQYFAHIIPVLGVLDHLTKKTDFYILPPDEFEAEYGWNYQSTESDYYIVRDEDDMVFDLYDEENDDGFAFGGQELPEGSFIDAVKRKVYGPMQINFPTHLLEDMDEIEMAEYEIDNLHGVEHCTYVQILDLSYNQIFDITQLEHCMMIQELYLSNNQIHYIDALYHMPDLRMLDLSNNSVEDITPLLHHKGLEFVNLLGNPISPMQIKQLKANGVVVVF